MSEKPRKAHTNLIRLDFVASQHFYFQSGQKDRLALKSTCAHRIRVSCTEPVNVPFVPTYLPHPQSIKVNRFTHNEPNTSQVHPMIVSERKHV